jgi:hypothetical protein
MIKNWLRKTLRNILHDDVAAREYVIEAGRANKIQDMLGSSGAALVAFKIDNGYLVRTMNQESILHGERMGGFTYCADRQAIADHIVVAAAKEKLGIEPAWGGSISGQYTTAIGKGGTGHTVVSGRNTSQFFVNQGVSK